MRMRRWTIVTVAVLAGALGAAMLERPSARAATAGWAAYVGGVDTSAGTAPELVVWNAAPQEVTLDLVLVDKLGATILEAPGEIVLGPRQTVTVDLNARLRRDLPKGAKPYAGMLTVELHGPAPFASDTALVHVTQYYGTRKRPRVAYVLRALFRDES
jgi:hypothetical protein